MGILLTSSRRLVHRDLDFIVDERRSVRVINATTGNHRTLRLIRRGRPSIILLSVQVPRVSNIRYAHHVGRRFPNVGIVVLAAFSSSSCIFSTLQCNTSNCLLGNISISNLAGTIQRTTQNNSVVTPSITSGILRVFSHVTRNSIRIHIGGGGTLRLAGVR